MCLMCVEISKQRMTVKEARRALRELMSTDQNPEDLAHYRELASLDDEGLVDKANEVNDDE